MKIAVISDLHLGAGDRADAFGHEDGEFLRFLDFLEDDFERIVLLGDIWETLTTPRPGDLAGGLDAARAAHPEIAKRFSTQPPYLYVHGNHDLVAGMAEGAPESLEMELDGARLLFTHGHHHDLLWREATWLSELGVWLGGWLRRLELDPMYRLFQSLDDVRGGVTEDARRCPFQKWAVELARMKQADIVVTGHTHVPVRADHGDRLFLNSGSCSQGAFSFLSLDTRAGSFELATSW